MADRFVLVSTRKWRDPWYRSLTLIERQVWNYLTEYPDETQTGIIERLHEDMAFECQMELSPFQGALKRFSDDGRVLFEGDNCLFIVKWLQHQIRSKVMKEADNRMKAINLELERLRDKCPMLVAEFEQYYKGITSPFEGAMEGLRYININISSNISSNISNSIAPTIEPAPKSTPKRSDKAEYSQDDLDIAIWVVEQIESFAEISGYKITNSRTPQSIAGGIHKSKLTTNEVELLFGWIQENEYQRKSTVNMVQWTTAKNWLAAWNKYKSHNDIAAQPRSGYGSTPVSKDYKDGYV